MSKNQDMIEKICDHLRDLREKKNQNDCEDLKIARLNKMSVC